MAILTEEDVDELLQRGRENLTEKELSDIHFAIMNTPKLYNQTINGAFSNKNYALFLSLTMENTLNHWFEKGKKNGEIH